MENAPGTLGPCRTRQYSYVSPGTARLCPLFGWHWWTVCREADPQKVAQDSVNQVTGNPSTTAACGAT